MSPFHAVQRVQLDEEHRLGGASDRSVLPPRDSTVTRTISASAIAETEVVTVIAWAATTSTPPRLLRLLALEVSDHGLLGVIHDLFGVGQHRDDVLGGSVGFVLDGRRVRQGTLFEVRRDEHDPLVARAMFRDNATALRARDRGCRNEPPRRRRRRPDSRSGRSPRASARIGLSAVTSTGVRAPLSCSEAGVTPGQSRAPSAPAGPSGLTFNPRALSRGAPKGRSTHGSEATEDGSSRRRWRRACVLAARNGRVGFTRCREPGQAGRRAHRRPPDA